MKKGYSHNIIFLDCNLGFGAANNIGIEIAMKKNVDFILLLNQDAWMHIGSLDLLINLISENQCIGIATPLHLNAKLSSFDRNFQDYLSSSDLTDYIFKGIKNLKLEFIETKFVNAAIWLLSASCIKKVGGFNPCFFHYGEDNEYCNRLESKGYKIAILPSAIGIHAREHRPISFSKRKEKLHCLNYAKIDYFKSTNERSFIRSQYKILFNTWGFKLNIIERVIMVLKFTREFKKLRSCKQIIRTSEMPFLNTEMKNLKLNKVLE